MQAEVPDEVSKHVRSCPECHKDLSIVRSLLMADGAEHVAADDLPDEPDDTVLPPQFRTAMADTGEGPADHDHRSDTSDAPSQSPTRQTDSGAAELGPTYNPLLASMVIVVTAALVIAGVLLWR